MLSVLDFPLLVLPRLPRAQTVCALSPHRWCPPGALRRIWRGRKATGPLPGAGCWVVDELTIPRIRRLYCGQDVFSGFFLLACLCPVVMTGAESLAEAFVTACPQT